jgi:hypothetical protein
MIQHRVDSLLADVAFAGTINRVAEGHVISGHRFGDGAGGATDAEKPASDLLSGANFGKGAVKSGIEVYL